MNVELGLSPFHRHMMVIAGVLSFVALTVLLVSGGMMNTYKKFDVVAETQNGGTVQCKQFYASCTCLGTVAVMESYPPQYDCSGIERCQQTNKTVCN